MIVADGVELCAESFGAAGDPPFLLIAGLGSSRRWWDEDLCRLLASRGRFVIRYDHRDTGRSVTYEPGRPGYTASDLDGDAVRVLDAYGVARAHLVGVSAGGGIAQTLASAWPGRVASLVLNSTTPAVPSGPRLPGCTEDFTRFVAGAEVDWSDAASVVEYLVGYTRLLSGRRPFDDRAVRELVRRDVERARDFRAAQNHDLLAHDGPGAPDAPLSAIAVPTVVIHGTADPMFPIEHGEALAAAIPGARLLRLDGAGHGVDRADWPVIADAIVALTESRG
jgi:pimeloyl-ACP methyl ester carboxylesterase